MLRLMNVQEIRENVFLVTLDRDGRRMEYEYTRIPPSDPDDWVRFDWPQQVQWDLIDYEVKPEPGQPQGALWIPALQELNRLVYKAADGEPLKLPIVLDER